MLCNNYVTVTKVMQIHSYDVTFGWFKLRLVYLLSFSCFNSVFSVVVLSLIVVVLLTSQGLFKGVCGGIN